MLAGELAKVAQRLAQDREPFVVATVVGAGRPTSVRPGDSAVVTADGAIEGFVGGVCAASTVRLYALRALETGEPVLLRLVPDDAESEETPEGAVVEHNPCLSGGSPEIFLEPQLPAARLVVVGGSPIAGALMRVGAAAGYDCANAGPVEGAAAVVVASHGSDERAVLSAALSTGVPYVALVASVRRGEAVRAELDVQDELRARLHTPAGLDIGAQSPGEIAVSILGQIVAEHHACLASPPPGDGVPVVAQAIDPVCGMSVAVSAATPQMLVGAESVYFCSEGCRERYAHDAVTG